MIVYKLVHNIGAANAGMFVITIMDSKLPIYLFENGRYVSFMQSEVNVYLEEKGEIDGTYKFENLMKLSKDFKQGFFDEMFEDAKKIKLKKDNESNSSH